MHGWSVSVDSFRVVITGATMSSGANQVMLAPVSAMMTVAVVWLTPGMVARCSSCGQKVAAAAASGRTRLIDQLHRKGGIDCAGAPP